MIKFMRSFGIAVVLLLTTVLIAQAGGWAVITLDELPPQITTGQTLTLGFIVRQHGKTLRDDLRPLLHFARADTTESFSATAEREGVSGHYSASVTFPSAGQWNWRVDIEQFGMVTQDMPALNVSAAAAPAGVASSAAASSAAASNALPVAAGLAGLIGTGAGLVLWFRTRHWWALAVAGAAIVIGLGGLIVASSSTALATASAPPDRTGAGRSRQGFI